MSTFWTRLVVLMVPEIIRAVGELILTYKRPPVFVLSNLLYDISHQILSNFSIFRAIGDSTSMCCTDWEQSQQAIDTIIT